jgi:hypothetical protein
MLLISAQISVTYVQALKHGHLLCQWLHQHLIIAYSEAGNVEVLDKFIVKEHISQCKSGNFVNAIRVAFFNIRTNIQLNDAFIYT